ncbi:hypothetical protein [Amycolatopsis sp. NBC_01480]|uniref:hypothetical protein n=1 Tax=Amycolatopsis sp. NBC_01480 TaxID=2903562 RepID=UPI002E2A1478|nr:hypothetical protein [Amycolatopsis sp. NBC_01480]
MRPSTATGPLRHWAPEVGDAEVAFACPSLPGAPADALPRVWPGRGLGLPETDVPGLVTALGTVMATPQFWRARRSGAGRGSEQIWSVPHTDPADGFLYVVGPCGRWNNTAGYRPVHSFAIPLGDVGGLRSRLAAHLHTG